MNNAVARSLMFTLTALLGMGLSAEGPRILEFGGIEWVARQSAGPVSPGPNAFSAAEDSVWVDAYGTLHLAVRKQGDTWTAAELTARRDAGWGSWTFTVELPEAPLDPNLVFGFFTWDKSPDFSNRELDIELAKWGVPENDELWFTVQPHDKPGNQHSARLGNARHLTLTLNWRADKLSFSCRGEDGFETRWTYAGPSPAPGKARLHFNLWLFGGKSPLSDGPWEIAISDFVRNE